MNNLASFVMSLEIDNNKVQMSKNISQFDDQCFTVYILMNNDKQNNIKRLILYDELPENNGYVIRTLIISEHRLEIFRNNKQKEVSIKINDILRVE